MTVVVSMVQPRSQGPLSSSLEKEPSFLKGWRGRERYWNVIINEILNCKNSMDETQTKDDVDYANRLSFHLRIVKQEPHTNLLAKSVEMERACDDSSFPVHRVFTKISTARQLNLQRCWSVSRISFVLIMFAITIISNQVLEVGLA